MPKQYITIDGKRVPVSDITSEEKPFPFSSNFHDKSIGEMICDISLYERTINGLEKMLDANKHNTDFAKKTREYAVKNIKGFKDMIIERENEIKHRREMAEKHNLRW